MPSLQPSEPPHPHGTCFVLSDPPRSVPDTPEATPAASRPRMSQPSLNLNQTATTAAACDIPLGYMTDLFLHFILHNTTSHLLYYPSTN